MRILIFSILLFLSGSSVATDLTTSQAILYIENDQAFAVFNVEWKNSWYNQRNKDAVWLFVKARLPGGGYKHIKLKKEGHSVISSFSKHPELEFNVSSDQVGLFLSSTQNYRGDISVSIKVMLDMKSVTDIGSQRYDLVAYGLEMVHITAGAHQIGSLDANAMEYGAFYKPNKEGNFGGPIDIMSEDQEISVSQNGDLFYYSGAYQYEGDQLGPIPPSFPKGVNDFYILKYELTEGQYSRFLNSLDSFQVEARNITSEASYAVEGGSIERSGHVFDTNFPNKPALFTSWDDAMAFADWAGLRPMTEFEFSKACRGSEAISASSVFPWSSASKLGVQRLPTRDRNLTMLNDWDESDLSNDNLEQFGASYYWVMDLAGSVWERLITIGHPKGRAFEGLHGDGNLDNAGFANIDNWPKGEDSGGIGFRGGGFYGYDRSYHEFNPFSPIAYRRYGGWHGPMRNNAYSTRFVRSAI